MAPIPDLELILLGTGTSSAVPSVGCLTSPTTGCLCCRSTLSPDAESIKNVRRNTSAVLRIPDKDGGRTKSLLIDCGKTFYSGALVHWSKLGLREIDAVLLTHPHSDAVLGLDDLRGWTLRQHIQASIDIYVNQFTFDEISKSFGYLTDTSKATGGGDVPQFVWHIFDDSKPITILGVVVTPLPVHHGWFFTSPPTPYFCLGFLFNSQIAYLSDVSFIPESVWSTIASYCTLPSSVTNGISSLSLAEDPPKPILQALVVDCLMARSHVSHFGLPQAVATARRSGALRTYLVGFSHGTTHASWVHTTKSFGAGALSTLSSDPAVKEPIPEHGWQLQSGTEVKGEEDREVFKNFALKGIESWEGGCRGGLWVRPGCDGLSIKTGEGGVGDSVYGE